jgi:hypothetical protein
MRRVNGRRAALTVALAATLGTGLGTRPAAAVQAASTANLGQCWLNKLKIGLGEDVNARDFVTRWHAGSTATIISGPVPHARLWSLTIYHTHRGKMQSFYDQQIVSGGSATFTLTIGGPKPHSGAWVDPTAGGADDEGYLIFRLYMPSGAVTLPSVAFTSKSGVPSALSSCSALSSDLRSAIARADKAHPSKGQTVGQSARHNLWPNNGNPFRDWSTIVDPRSLVSANNVSAVPLITQLADPNALYHVVFFNLSQGDMVLHGTLPPISPQAPRTGMRYFSLCAYPTDESYRPLACLDDSSIKTSAHRDYVLVVSPDQPSDTSNWLNPGSTNVGAVVMRWLLPAKGAQASFCIPSVDYRQPGETNVPSLGPGC